MVNGHLVKREIAGIMIFVAIGMVVEVFVTGLPRLNHQDRGWGGCRF